MDTFRARRAPDDAKQLPQFVSEQLREVEQAANRAASSLRLQVLYAAPSKVQAGMVVYADGTTWDPGSGEGLYRYSLAGSWVHLG